MTTSIVLLIFALLIGLAGAIILTIGIISRKNLSIISGGVLLLVTVLLCIFSITCSTKCSPDRFPGPGDERMMRMEPGMHREWDTQQKVDSCCRQKKDSVCVEKRVEKRRMQDQRGQKK